MINELEHSQVSDVMAAISLRVVAELAATAHAPLFDGSIPIGPEFLGDLGNVPRIVIDPQLGGFTGPSDYGDVRTGPILTLATLPPFALQGYGFDVYIYAIDYDDLAYLTNAFVRASYDALSTAEAVFGKQRPIAKGPLVMRNARAAILPMTWYRPVPRTAFAIPLAPEDTVGAGFVILEPGDDPPIPTS